MIKKLLHGVFGSRHSRELRRIQPILAEIRTHGERLKDVSEDEIKAQTAKFRGIIRERTSELEARIAQLKETKHAATDAKERERIDTELTGLDGQGGLEADLRNAIAAALDEILPEAFATVREAARRLVGTNVDVTNHELKWDMVH